MGFILTILLFPVFQDRDQTGDPVRSTSFRSRYFVLYLFSIICQNPRQIDQSQFLRGSWRPSLRILMIDNQQVHYKISIFFSTFLILRKKYSTIAHLGKV